MYSLYKDFKLVFATFYLKFKPGNRGSKVRTSEKI